MKKDLICAIVLVLVILVEILLLLCKSLDWMDISWWMATIVLWMPLAIVMVIVNIFAACYVMLTILRILGGKISMSQWQNQK